MILVWWPQYARLMRGQVLSVKNHEYISAARMVGVPDWQILFKHVLPNTTGPIPMKPALDAGSVILMFPR